LTDLCSEFAAEPIGVRMRYHNTLAMLYNVGEQPEQLKRELAGLERMATVEKCLLCGFYKIVREIPRATRRQDLATANRLLLQLDGVAKVEPDLMQSIHYARGAAFELGGNYTRAIEESIKATQLAIDTNNPAEEVRSLNMLILGSIGRRDLSRAEALANEAYALAQRIGFFYMMAYVRGNQGGSTRSRVSPDRLFKRFKMP
jgi:hypothetical protein